MPNTRDPWKAEDLYPPPEDLQPPDTRLEEVPRDIATFRQPERRPESFFGGSIVRNHTYPPFGHARFGHALNARFSRV